jgi:hypothetical protein
MSELFNAWERYTCIMGSKLNKVDTDTDTYIISEVCVFKAAFSFRIVTEHHTEQEHGK